MHRFSRKVKLATLVALSSLALVSGACSSDADVVSENLSTAADNFEINRRIVFYNSITDKYIMTVEGLCSLGNNDPQYRLSVTCKVGEEKYVKHFLGISDNVTYFVEQLQSAPASAYHYRVVFKPETIVPDIDLRTSP